MNVRLWGNSFCRRLSKNGVSFRMGTTVKNIESNVATRRVICSIILSFSGIITHILPRMLPNTILTPAQIIIRCRV